MNNDGSIIINAELDYKQLEQAADVINKVTSDAAKDGSDHFASLQVSWNEVVKAFESSFATLDSISDQDIFNAKWLEGAQAGLAGLQRELDTIRKGLSGADWMAQFPDMDSILKDGFSTEHLDKLNEAGKKVANTYNSLLAESKGLSRAVATVKKEIDGQSKSVEKTAKATDGAARATQNLSSKGNEQVSVVSRMEREHEALNNKIRAQEELLEKLKQRYDALNAKREIPGFFTQQDEAELQKLDVQISKTEYSIEQLITKSDKMAVSMDKAEQETGEMGNSLNKASKDVSLMETALVAMILNGLAKAVDAMMDAVDASLEFRKQLSFVEVNANAAGKSMAEAEEIMAKFALTTDNTNEIMGATSAMLATGLGSEEMLQMIDLLNGAMIKLGDSSFNTGAVTKSYLKTLEQGKAVGQFAYMLESLGVDVDALNKRLESTNDTATRQKMIMQELSNYGLQELAAEYGEVNPELVALYQAQNRYNEALGETGKRLQPVETLIINIKAWLLELFNKLPPEIQQAVAGFGKFAVAILTAAAAATVAKKAFGTFKETWNIGGTAKQAAQDVSSMGTSLQTAGTAAGKAKTGFLEAALGIMLIAVSVAAIILALAVLVTAFSDFNGDALETAGAIAAIIVAASGMVVALSFIAKSVQGNTSSMMMFAAVIGIIASAISVIILALTALVKAMNESDESAMEIASAITMIVFAVGAAIGIIAMLGTTMGDAAPKLMMFGVALLVVAAAVAIIALAVATLIYAIKGIPPIQIDYNIASMPNMGQLQGRARGGFAVGTQSASKGWHIVGENGPEAINFGGGERVLTASQTMAQQANMAAVRNQSVVYQIGEISIPADNVSSFVDVVNIMRNEATSIQQGYTGG